MTPPARADRGGTVVLASDNPGKLAEFRRLLAAAPLQLVGLRDAGFTGVLEEPAVDYAGNALAKAGVASAALGLPALADDSGIEVDALGGWPGPRSARWLGADADDAERRDALIAEVDRRCPGAREVRYVCVLALVWPPAGPVLARGECSGTLVTARGDGGFGYDPAFLSSDLGRTFGEATQAEKDGVSHRGRAVHRLLQSALPTWPSAGA